MQIKKSDDPRVAAALGLEGPVHFATGPGAVIAWDSMGALATWGSAAARVQTFADQASSVDDAAPPEHVMQIASPAPAPPTPEIAVLAAPELAGTPHEGENPLSWLSRIAQVEAIRDWVVSQGLASGSADEWASFAKSMGWTLPPPTTADANPEEAQEMQGETKV
jgi:hypothetical protein